MAKAAGQGTGKKTRRGLRASRGSARRVADAEDVALSALDSFCRAAEQGRFADLADRDSLWRLLVVMTARKTNQLRRDEGRHKRGGALQPVAEMAGEEESLLGRLGDDELRQVALWRMEGPEAVHGYQGQQRSQGRRQTGHRGRGVR
jgi:hypothetical protein